MAAFGGRDAVGRAVDVVVSWVKGPPWREVTSTKPITLSLVVYQLCQCPRENRVSGKGSEGEEERQGKERVWTPGKEVVKEETISLAHSACMVRGLSVIWSAFGFGEAPITWGLVGKGHLLSVSTPGNQSTGTWLRSGPLEAFVWHSRTQGQIKASHKGLVIVVVAVGVSGAERSCAMTLGVFLATWSLPILLSPYLNTAVGFCELPNILALNFFSA